MMKNKYFRIKKRVLELINRWETTFLGEICAATKFILHKFKVWNKFKTKEEKRLKFQILSCLGHFKTCLIF